MKHRFHRSIIGDLLAASAPSIDEQLRRGALVCPRTLQPLLRDGDRLCAQDGSATYRIVDGVPVLLSGADRGGASLLGQDDAMVKEYDELSRLAALPKPPMTKRVSQWLSARAAASRTAGVQGAFQELFRGIAAGALCLSIGGGPTRVDPRLVNLNVGPFANVDVVADAYALPYATGSVDAVHCEAVLEHLEFPDKAVQEMYRVLRPGARVYAATPFLQAFHGYPDHFQNFTLNGHRRLFERAGFLIERIGPAVGPIFALRDLAGQTLRHGFPSALGRWLYGAWLLATLPMLALDRRLGEGEAGRRVASLTYLLARKA
ncbi:MAG TPA: methyltransferase domain-containing protein [Thermoanaerobaculia bacterium]|nr:methyltransferase domain-containing protein [Thermoanaerobaculia bacterium]